METVSDLDVERGYEVARETQEAESIMNGFLPLVQDLMGDDFSDKLYTYLSNINGEKRLAEVNKWKEYMLSYGDELKSLFGDEYVFNGSMKELEPFFKGLEVMENEKKGEQFSALNDVMGEMEATEGLLVKSFTQSDLSDLKTEVVG